MEKDIITVVKNSKVTHPIATAAIKGNRYWTDFLTVIDDYKKVLNTQEYSRFLDKSQLDCEITLAQYLQFSSEVTIVDYIIRNYSDFKNEPKYNEKKNPECSFQYGGRTINIEVKCPDMTKRIMQETSKGIKLFVAERFPDKKIHEMFTHFIESSNCENQNIHSIDRLDNRLKDYLTSAHKKFPTSDLSNFNILVIALDIIQDMDEWYSYLFGDNGAFTDRTFITDIMDDYSNVDAVLLTNVQHGHMADNVYLDINCWHLEHYVSLLLLDPRKEEHHGLGEYYKEMALDLFGGLTRNFLGYQCRLDQRNKSREQIIRSSHLDEGQKKKLFRTHYEKDKVTDLQIVSAWVNTLNKKA